MNVVALAGRLATDVEMREVAGGTAVANFRLAVDRPFKNKDGEREADFFTVVAWGQRAEFVSRWFAKGSWIGVQGRLQHRTWEKDGQRRSAVEVVAEQVLFVGDKARDDEEPPF